MTSIKKYIADKKEKIRMQEEANIKSEFAVVERGGSIWLTHDGVAFIEFDYSADAEFIAKAIGRCRDTAIKYRMGWK